MTSGKSYKYVVAGLSTGDAPVKFTIKKDLAGSTFDAARNLNLASGSDPALRPEIPASSFKVEIGVTEKFNVLVCRTTYGYEKNEDGDVVRSETVRAFSSATDLAGARSAMDPTQPADAACLFQMKDLKDWATKETVEV